MPPLMLLFFVDSEAEGHAIAALRSSVHQHLLFQALVPQNGDVLKNITDVMMGVIQILVGEVPESSTPVCPS